MPLVFDVRMQSDFIAIVRTVLLTVVFPLRFCGRFCEAMLSDAGGTTSFGGRR